MRFQFIGHFLAGNSELGFPTISRGVYLSVADSLETHHRFWFCVFIDAILLAMSFVFVPETLAIPKELRPKFTIASPFKPLTELKHKQVGLMCLLSGANHGVLCARSPPI
jgi:hypothetical protein